MVQTNETKELLTDFAKSIQQIDEQLFDLNERKKEIFKQAKDDGFTPAALKKAIQLIGKEPDPVVESETELYMDIISDVIAPLK